MTDPVQRTITLIGIGPGHVDHLTLEAIHAIESTDVFIVLEKGAHADDLASLRQRILERHAGDHHRVIAIDDSRWASDVAYRDAVRTWHEERSARLAEALIEQVAESESVAMLVWGDPSLYDSAIRMFEHVNAGSDVAVDIAVIPGVSSVQLLAARHRIMLNRIGRPVLVTTGRLLSSAGFPDGVDDVVVMVDGDMAFMQFTELDVDIYWGAYLGMDAELLVAGRLADVADQIAEVRATAKETHGWMFDIYLLRRHPRDLRATDQRLGWMDDAHSIAADTVEAVVTPSG